MKRIRTALLIAAAALVATPALADDRDARHGGDHHNGRENNTSARPAPPQAQRPAQAPQAPRPQPAPAAPQAGNEGARQRGNWNGGNRPADTGAARAQWQANRGQGQGYRGDNRPGNPGGDAAQYSRDRGQWNRNDGQQRGDPRFGQNGDRRGDGDHRGGNDRRNDGDHRWDNNNGNDHRWDGNDRYGNGRGGHRPDTNWRNDRRYDWRGWRNSHGNIFRGRYNAPHGYGYRSVYRGFFLEPFFYGSSYWLADPYQYRLPPAEWPYRWVRYYDDALLVDTTSGEVVDVIQGFFF